MATASASDEIVFVIPGQVDPQAPPAVPGEVQATVRLGTERGAGDSVRVAARPGRDVVVLSVHDGPTLVLHPESARDLMLAQQRDGTRGGTGTAATDTVLVPATLGWPGLESLPTRGGTRGRLGQVLLRAVQVITGRPQDSAARFVTQAVVKKLDGQVVPGVYRLQRDTLTKLKDAGTPPLVTIPAPPETTLLVLAHGTFVDTASTFAKLWVQHPGLVERLFDAHADHVYALDHPTLGESPIANALTLARALPERARLRLVTHSRGGLVAEVLARASAGLAEGDLALFADRDGRNYARYRSDLKALAEELQHKQVKVERVVRVACPARGTLLASKRLDAYLSVLKWGLELAQVPVAPELVDFLGAVAQRRTDPTELPGLESMTPDSPVVAWLNRATEILPGQLRVVAGDLEGDSLGSWLKTLLADAFYWTDNDLVVQTRSMYGGVPRANEGASFLLDRGGRVTHFNYFANDRTAEAIVDAVLNDNPADFRLIGPLSWGGTDASGSRASRAARRSSEARDGVPASARPAVFVLPGILGSNLKAGGQRIWLGLRFVNGLGKLAWTPDAGDIVEDGPIGRVYDDLVEYLAETHEVVPFGFDWRRPLEQEAVRLAERVQAMLDARTASGQPVRIVAHSMGGLLARTMRLVAPEVWSRMLAREGARVLMLGTPNAGSWAPMQTLSGDDTFGNTLAAFGALFDDHGARAVMAGMPGFLQLQAGLLDPELKDGTGRRIDLGRSESWAWLADEDQRLLREQARWHNLWQQLSIYAWSAPPQPVLDYAVDLRRRLDAQIEKLGPDTQKMLLVVGRARFTPAGIALGEEGLVYMNAEDGGDGRVTRASAMQLGVRTWQADTEHGSLPGLRSAFEGYLELLESGTTGRLPELAAAGGTAGAGDSRSGLDRDGGRRGGGEAPPPAPLPLVPSRPSRGRRPPEPPSTELDLYAGAEGEDAAGESGQALVVTVLNANLKFCGLPLLVGHYRSNELSGSEAVVDRLVGGCMSQSLQAGLYPQAIGSQQLFANRRRDPANPVALPRPPAVVVAGLGEEGSLRVRELTQTLRQAVIAYAQQQRDGNGALGFGLASTLVGSGGSGMSPGSSAQAVVQAVRDANEQLRRVGWPQVTALTLVELYLDRSTEAQRAVEVLSDAQPSAYRLSPTIASGSGALRRPLDSTYRGAGYDFISVRQRFDEKHEPVVEYTLDTLRARSEVRGQSTQSRLVDELVRIGADSDNTDAAIRRSLFQLLVPIEIEPFLAGSTTMVLQLDPATARYPWELLDDGRRDGRDDRPWSVRTKLLRKLRTDIFREQPMDGARDGGVLVIGEPKCDPERYGPLPAAQEEARLVARTLGARPLLGPDATGTVKALLAEPLRIVHIAGHGDIVKEGDSETGGVILSGNMMLGPREIRAMRTVPELVFVNCCFLGSFNTTPPAKAQPRRKSLAEFAANVAEELIRMGVRCVVAAGWAVEDEPAKVFALTFYERLLQGERFIDALGAAREAAYRQRPAGNTWAAYQCYGDPDWRYQPPPTQTGRETTPAPLVVSAPALALELETLALEQQYDDVGADAAAQRRGQLRRQSRLDRVKRLERGHGAEWGRMGAVAEAFGLVYAQLGDRDAAIRWYRHAVQAPDASASFRSAEQLGNLLARRGGAPKAAPDAALKDLHEAIGQLDRLVALQASVERESLLGSAWKRRAELLRRTPDGAETPQQALAEAARHYLAAEALAGEQRSPELFYPAMNALACELQLAILAGRALALDPERLVRVRQSLEARALADPDFWTLAGLGELAILEAVAAGRLAAAAPKVLDGLRDLHLRVAAAPMWDSVLTQARFVVGTYGDATGDAAEKRAAADYLRELATYAGG